MFRATRIVRSAVAPLKASTGITGLAVHPNPLPTLLETYRSTESLLSKMPQESVYRQATSAIIKYRSSVIERAAGDVAKVEQELDAGQIEEVIEAAKDELKLAGNMMDWKPWEELQLKAPEGQWAPIGHDMGQAYGSN